MPSLPKSPGFLFHFGQESFEAWVLLAAALVYVCCVYFTGDLINAIPALRPAAVVLEDELASPSKRKGKMHGIEVEELGWSHGKWGMDGRFFLGKMDQHGSFTVEYGGFYMFLPWFDDVSWFFFLDLVGREWV